MDASKTKAAKLVVVCCCIVPPPPGDLSQRYNDELLLPLIVRKSTKEIKYAEMGQKVAQTFLFSLIAVLTLPAALSADGSHQKLCVLCQSVLNRLKGQAEANEQHFKEELLTSCSLVENPAEAKKCRQGVSDAKVARLRKEGSEEICVAEGFCGKDELQGLQEKLDWMEKRIDGRKQKFEKGLRPIPPVVLGRPEKTVHANKTNTNQTTNGC
uniref:Saposin B-type domain-containing protein n=1 Tax=Globodera rostochiensis TaxID=31243 RepID=A0A914I2K0_GLORO